MAKDLENTMVGNNVYILTEITNETTNGLLIQLTQWVDKLPLKNNLIVPQKPDEKDITDDTVYIIGKANSYKSYTPYEAVPNNIPVLNVWINSGGGKTNITKSVLSVFNMASAKGTIIKTYNLASASSSASMIAISGTPGYRYMAENAYNYIHFGRYSADAAHTDEIDILTNDLKIFDKTTRLMYLNNTKLTNKELTRYYNTEGAGRLYADQCLQKGLCDWVITNDGRFVNNVNELKSKQR